jgi:SAM-dependent methyltransferase
MAGSAAWCFATLLARRVPLNHALWRACEAGVLAEVPMARPILDLGCGDGLFASLLFEQPVECGIDFDLSRLTRARDSGAYRDVKAADATHLPFDAGAFGTVFSNSVLEHIPDVDAVCREAARVLRPGGQLVFTVPSDHFGDFLFWPAVLRALGLGTLAALYAGAMNRVFVHRHTDGADRWRARLERAGLELVVHRQIMPLPLQALWDLLMPYAALQVLLRRAWRGWPHPLERILLRLARGALEPLLEPRGRPGANLVVVARKPAAGGTPVPSGRSAS